MTDLKKIAENIYEIKKTGNMNVPVVVYASEKLLADMKKDKCLEQMQNVASLPGIVKQAIVLPDAHQGYGFSIGGVAGFDMDKGIISPGGVGYDISCSCRLLKTNLERKDLEGQEKKISQGIFRAIPSGVGKGGKVKVDKKELKEILEKGAKWAVEKGYGTKDDYEHVEESGCMNDANVDYVSDRAISRGLSQVGSLGAGNHFMEIQVVDEIFDKEVAKTFGLKKNQITIMIHCGSRGLGHQVASDYIKLMEDEYGFETLPDRELINAPINSELGKKYYGAMCAAANFAFCNKQIITHFIREEMRYYFPKFKADVVYEVCHNIAKFEEHIVDGKLKKLCVHRKGATRSLGPENKLLPKDYKKVGQPVIIPGSMGTASYVLVGTKKAEEISFSSTAHGAGRVMSRHEALRTIKSEDVKKKLEEKNISVVAGSKMSLVEESSDVYKNIDEVVRVSDELGIGKLVARLKPIIVIKG